MGRPFEWDAYSGQECVRTQVSDTFLRRVSVPFGATFDPRIRGCGVRNAGLFSTPLHLAKQCCTVISLN